MLTSSANKILEKNPLELPYHNNYVKESLNEPFGIDFRKGVFDEIKGEEAIKTLLTYKLGQVKGAFYKEGLGDIDLVWGNEKMGLAHILDKHPEVIEKIPEVIEKGKVENANGVDTIILKSENKENYHIGLSKGWYGEGDNKWILTAYERNKPPHSVARPSNEVASRGGNNLPSNDFKRHSTTEKLTNQELIDLHQKLTEKYPSRFDLPLYSYTEHKVQQMLKEPNPYEAMRKKYQTLIKTKKRLDGHKLKEGEIEGYKNSLAMLDDPEGEKFIKAMNDDVNDLLNLEDKIKKQENSKYPNPAMLKDLEENKKAYEQKLTEIKNQDIANDIKQSALELADKENPTQDTQPYRPLVDSIEKRILQNKAEGKKEVKFNDLEDIKKDLPYLLHEQAEDVKFAEDRFSTGNRGVLFTNGTGTGKTLTGLGIIKRKIKMGAKNILILTQSTQKNADWKKEGEILNLDIVEVKDTKDNPNGVIVATYANFRQNEGLTSRTYDLVVYDESQSIIGSKEGDSTEVFLQHQKITIWNYLEPNTPRTDGNFDRANQLAKNNQVIFLSATPFASHKALKYGEGLLFDRVDNDFLMNNFGYSFRYGKLTKPTRGADVGQLERDFADRLAKSGVKRGRRLVSDYDYHRSFMKVDGGLGKEIDGALDILMHNKEYRDLYIHYRKKFNYHYVNKISESIKAKETLDFVKDNLKEGRKVVIFHSYNEGGVPHPFIENFDLKGEGTLFEQYERFKQQYPQYFKEMHFENPLELYKKELGNRVDFYNGRVNKKNRSKALENFNEDDSGVDVLVVQIDAGGTGISLHDTTGKHPRVALKLNIPTKPITEIQSEGRIYRTGQKSNASYVYPVTHLGIEQKVFGGVINERIGVVENLALGSEARNLKDTFKQGYLEAKELTADALEFVGGKEYDRAVDKMEPYAKAINDYFSYKPSKFDGQDYFPTPEPIGYKMSQWADVLDGESVLEPSAGSGSIARYFSEGARATAIEPSSKLFSKLQINISSEAPRLINGTFEDLNIGNKFDGIVMNPPFGEHSALALAHLKKALGHLNSEGRVVALVPNGNSMMKHLENLSEFTKDIKKGKDEEFKMVAEIALPQATFKRAGTSVSTKILVIDKTKNDVMSESYDLSHINDIEELFAELGNIELPKRERIEKEYYDEPLSMLLHLGVLKANDKKLSVSTTGESIERSRFNEIWHKAKSLGGQYSKGKITFPDSESYKKFIESEDC